MMKKRKKKGRKKERKEQKTETGEWVLCINYLGYPATVAVPGDDRAVTDIFSETNAKFLLFHYEIC